MHTIPKRKLITSSRGNGHTQAAHLTKQLNKIYSRSVKTVKKNPYQVATAALLGLTVLGGLLLFRRGNKNSWGS